MSFKCFCVLLREGPKFIGPHGIRKGGGYGCLQREKGNGQKLLRIKSDDNNFQERKNDGVTTLSEKNMYDPFDKSL